MRIVVGCQADESAVSGGGEDQGAEEAFMGQERVVFRQFLEAVSRASGSAFSALRPNQILDLRPGTGGL